MTSSAADRLVALALGLSLTACPLRATYGQLAGVKGEPVRLQLIDEVTRRPLGNVKVEAGEGKGKVALVTAADGTVTLTPDAKLKDELVVVSLPAGAVRGVFVPAPPLEPPPAPAAAPAEGTTP